LEKANIHGNVSIRQAVKLFSLQIRTLAGANAACCIEAVSLEKGAIASGKR
jgi:hypothetical protein